MKKAIFVIIFGLLWCNVGFGKDSMTTLFKNNEIIDKFNAEVELNKMLSNSSLPKCEGSEGLGWDEVKQEYVEWNNCIGKADPMHTNTDLSTAGWMVTELAVYVGEFVNGNFEGKGMILWGDIKGLRRLYIGEFKNDVPHGEGIVTTGFTEPFPGRKQLIIRRTMGTDDSAVKGIWEDGYRSKIWKNGKWIDWE